MKAILSLLVLVVGGLMLAGCCATNRTLTWADGKLTMTEDSHGHPTTTWELKEVTAKEEANALRRAGWKSAGIVLNPGGVDLYLLKRRLTAVQSVATRPPFRPVLITAPGTYSASDGDWRVDVSENSINFAPPAVGSGGFLFRQGLGFASDSRGWKAQPGWFVFVENESRVWAYDGGSRLYLASFSPPSCGLFLGTFRKANFDSNFPCAMPAEVVSHLPEQRQKEIQKNG